MTKIILLNYKKHQQNYKIIIITALLIILLLLLTSVALYIHSGDMPQGKYLRNNIMYTCASRNRPMACCMIATAIVPQPLKKIQKFFWTTMKQTNIIMGNFNTNFHKSSFKNSILSI